MEAGVRVAVEPWGIFTTLIPTPVLLQPGPAPGAMPDWMPTTPSSTMLLSSWSCSMCRLSLNDIGRHTTLAKPTP